MGSPESEIERYEDEIYHHVTLTRGFWMADSVCTQEMWGAVTGIGGSTKGDRVKPVTQVSWNDVDNDFLPALNTMVLGLEAILPTEAQWEYACRAGSVTPFWFGEHISSEQVAFDGSRPYSGGGPSKYRGHTVPVKSLPANGWGLYEMHGNVYEWCSDWLSDYPSEAVVDPAGPSDIDQPLRRVMRGGAFISPGRNCRAAERNAIGPNERHNHIGFRLAREAC